MYYGGRTQKTNIAKTKVMRMNTNVTILISVAGHAIEEVNDFVYLGCSVFRDRGADMDFANE